MKTLHLVRSNPDEQVNWLVEILFAVEKNETIYLFDGEIDYNKLLTKIFASDRVVCWW